MGPLVSKTGVVLSYLGLPSVFGFRGALGTSSVQLGDEQHMVFFGVSISMFFPLTCNSFFRVCICIGSHQSVIARGGGGRQQGPRASSSSFLALSLWDSILPPIPVFSLWESWDCPLVCSLLSRGGVVFISDGFFRETLSLGLDLVFCFFLGLMFSHGVPKGDEPRLVDLLCLWSLGGEGSLLPELSFWSFGKLFEVFVFLFARTYWFL